jgi:type VI secretion system secreted protein VgrG
MPGPAGTSRASGALARAAGAAGGLTGALNTVGPMANMAKQAVGAVQAVQKGGAQGLLAQAGQTALGKAASSVPGGALAVNALSGGLSAKGGSQALLGQASGSLESMGMPPANTLSASVPTGLQAIQALKLPGAIPRPSMPALPTSLSKPDLLASFSTSPSIKPSFSINDLVT